MAFEFHKDASLRFQQQYKNSKEYLIPFVEEVFPLKDGMKVLEIGCGDGGVLKPFVERGCICLGVDLNETKINVGRELMKEDIEAGKIKLIYKNIYDVDFENDVNMRFDVIVLKDAIEHIPEQKKLVCFLQNLLTEKGKIFFGFPPWYMPFGGHQQVCHSKILSKLPYYHLLPKFLYRGILKLFKEPKPVITELMEIVDTGISIERFERITRKCEYKIYRETHFLINPIYKEKFGLKPRKQFWIIKKIPFFRNFYTTAVYYLIGK